MSTGSTSGRPLDLSWMTPEQREKFVARFMRKVAKEGGEHGCWVWTGSIIGGGSTYGNVGIPPRDATGRWCITGAHRVSHAIHNGPVPAGTVVMHSCDRKICVNPAHLSIGTQSENVKESVRKGQQYTPGGEMANGAKLTAEQVALIRATPPGTRGLDKRFGVERHTISRARQGKTWKSLG